MITSPFSQPSVQQCKNINLDDDLHFAKKHLEKYWGRDGHEERQEKVDKLTIALEKEQNENQFSRQLVNFYKIF